MPRVIRTRAVQPDTSPGMIVAAIVLVIVFSLDLLVWWSLLLILCIPPLVNQLILGYTHIRQLVIEKDL